MPAEFPQAFFVLSPHPASFPGGLSLLPGSFLLSAFGLSRLVSLPGFSGSGPVFPDFHVPVFPAFRLWTFPALVLPGFSDSGPVFPDLPVPVFPAFRLRVFPVPAPFFFGPPPAFPTPTPAFPGFPGTRLPSGYSQPFSGIVFSGPASASGIFRRFFRNTHSSGTPAARVSHITTPRASVTPST